MNFAGRALFVLLASFLRKFSLENHHLFCISCGHVRLCLEPSVTTALVLPTFLHDRGKKRPRNSPARYSFIGLVQTNRWKTIYRGVPDFSLHPIIQHDTTHSLYLYSFGFYRFFFKIISGRHRETPPDNRIAHLYYNNRTVRRISKRTDNVLNNHSFEILSISRNISLAIQKMILINCPKGAERVRRFPSKQPLNVIIFRYDLYGQDGGRPCCGCAAARNGR